MLAEKDTSGDISHLFSSEQSFTGMSDTSTGLSHLASSQFGSFCEAVVADSVDESSAENETAVMQNLLKKHVPACHKESPFRMIEREFDSSTPISQEEKGTGATTSTQLKPVPPGVEPGSSRETRTPSFTEADVPFLIDTNFDMVPEGAHEDHVPSEVQVITNKEQMPTTFTQSSPKATRPSSTCEVAESSVKQTEKRKRLKRPCPFCDAQSTDLRRHIMLRHKTIQEVEEVLKGEKDGTLSRKERIRLFGTFYKDGMYKENIDKISGDDNNLLCMKKSSGKKVICVQCKGAYNQKYLHRHKKLCKPSQKNAQENAAFSIAGGRLKIISSDFQRILQRMKKDDIHEIIMKDNLIQLIGEHIFLSKKPGKEKDAKIKARNAMRRLAKLLLACSEFQTSIDMFMVRNINLLEEAIIKLCDDKQFFKPGLNVALGTLIKLSAKILRTHFLIKQEKTVAEELFQFSDIFKMYYPRICSKAEYCLKEKRQRDTRKPSSLPNENDLNHLNTFLTSEIGKLSKKSLDSRKDFVRLRKLTLARLTLLNARRGSEVSRLQISHYEERNSWIEKNLENISEEDNRLLEKYSICFIMGKGHSLIPILIPKSCEEALSKLVDTEVRKIVGVDHENDYVFAYTQQSQDVVTGYNEIRNVCEEIGIPTITATGIRHRASTLFWRMEGLNEDTISTFMAHMGHSEDIDRNIYAVPHAVRAISHVAPLIERMDMHQTHKRKDAPNPSTSSHVRQIDSESDDTESEAETSVGTDELDELVKVPLGLNDRNKTKRGKSKCRRQGVTYTDEIDGEEEELVQAAYRNKGKKPKMIPRHKWSRAATDAIKNHFMSYINGQIEKKYPGREEIEQFKAGAGLTEICNVDWSLIKTKVFNEKMTLRKKIQNSSK